MRNALGWLLLAAFSFGLSMDLSRGMRSLLAVWGLVLSTMGLIYTACAQTGEPPAATRSDEATPATTLHADVDDVESHEEDLHEKIVRESFQCLSPLEAATLVGVLHHYRIVPFDHATFPKALELHAAARLVARSTGYPKGYLRRLYRDRWNELRGSAMSHGIRRHIERHELVRELIEFPELG